MTTLQGPPRPQKTGNPQIDAYLNSLYQWAYMLWYWQTSNGMYAGSGGAFGNTATYIPGLDGEDGEDGASIIGPRGPQGLPGQIIPGMDGQDGEDASVSIPLAVNLGSAAYQSSAAFATATQGGKADTALQPSTDISVNKITGATSSGAHALTSTDNAGNYAVTITHNAATANNQYPLMLKCASDPNNATADFLDCIGNATLRGSWYSNGGIANYSANDVNLSSETLKTPLEPLPSYWEKWKQFQFGTYLYLDQTDNLQNIGVTAEQIGSIAPELKTSITVQKAVLSADSPILDEMGKTVQPGGAVITPAKEVPGIWQTDMWMVMGKVVQECQQRIEAVVSDFEVYKVRG